MFFIPCGMIINLFFNYFKKKPQYNRHAIFLLRANSSTKLCNFAYLQEIYIRKIHGKISRNKHI